MKLSNIIQIAIAVIIFSALIGMIGVMRSEFIQTRLTIEENNRWIKEIAAVGNFYSIKEFGDQSVILVPIAMNAFVDAQERFKEDHGRYIRISSSYRTHTAQNWLFSMFQYGQNPYPVATPGYSYHEVGLAVDIQERDMNLAHPYLIDAGFEGIGIEDPVHYQFALK